MHARATPRLPTLPGDEVKLGLGLDLPWGRPIGWSRDGGRDHLSPRVARFLERYGSAFGSVFVSWQPRDRAVLRAEDYFEAFDNFARLTPNVTRALHHTALNTGALSPEDPGHLIDVTNAWIERYGMAWVNEDLGLWSLLGRRLPYPLPPFLTESGLRACIRNIDVIQRRLAAPFLVEFPGFTEGASFAIGAMNAYDYFASAVEETGSPCTLDVAHLLGYQWMSGRRGEDLFADLDRLPTSSCFEIHLSGCQIVGEQFVDSHHGVLHALQFELLSRLVPLCPNLRVITFEDPKFTDDGVLISASTDGFERLRGFVDRLGAQEEPLETPADLREGVPEAGDAEDLEETLYALLYDQGARAEFAARGWDLRKRSPFDTVDMSQLEKMSRLIVRDLLRRSHVGSGALPTLFPLTVQAWRAQHPEDPELRSLIRDFCASPSFRKHREVPTQATGLCLEETFYRFCLDADFVDVEVLEAEFLAVMIRSLAVTPEPAFSVPAGIRSCATGWFALLGTPERPILHAACGGQLITGEITALLAALLQEDATQVAAAHGVSVDDLAPAIDHLRSLGLLPASA